VSLVSDQVHSMTKRRMTRLFTACRALWRRLARHDPAKIHQFVVAGENDPRGLADLVPYDDTLLERSRTQWQFGDWASLAAIPLDTLQHHPDRARLALLAAAGRLQTDNLTEARSLLRQAMAWGCSRKQMSQILASSVHNLLGRGAAVAGMDERASLHFEAAVAVGNPQADVKLVGHARALRELVSLGMLPQAASYLGQSADRLKQTQLGASHAQAQQKVLVMEVDWLRDRVVQLDKQSVLAQLNAATAARLDVSRQPPPAPAAAPPANEVKKYYGLHGLDKKLESYLDFDGGFFVELGANDGVAQSNTLYFERERGWRGVLIEPILHNYLKCRQNRSEDNAFFCAACVSDRYAEPYVRLTYANLMTAPHGVVSDIADPSQHAQSGSMYLPAGEVPVDVMAVARTLSSLLDEAQAPFKIDLLSLDVEGGELEVLKGINHSRHRFRYMLIECRDPQRLASYLTEVGYVLIDKISQHDYLYANNEV
jgi:FkbM family methyltransferase